jgi:aspartokinase
MDMLLSAGERISMALLAMAIRTEGVEARSLTGSQAAIITDGSHTAARIVRCAQTGCGPRSTRGACRSSPGSRG